MKKTVLNEKVAEVKPEPTPALQTLYDALNQGQQNKVVKNAEVKELFDRYGVNY